MVLHRKFSYCVRENCSVVQPQSCLAQQVTSMRPIILGDFRSILLEVLSFCVNCRRQLQVPSLLQSCAGKRSAREHSGASDTKRTRGGNNTRKEWVKSSNSVFIYIWYEYLRQFLFGLWWYWLSFLFVLDRECSLLLIGIAPTRSRCYWSGMVLLTSLHVMNEHYDTLTKLSLRNLIFVLKIISLISWKCNFDQNLNLDKMKMLRREGAKWFEAFP